MNAPAVPDDLRNVAVLGATGSIGRASIDVITRLGSPWKLWGISGHNQTETLLAQAVENGVKHVVCTGPMPLQPPAGIQLQQGTDALVALASHPDVHTVVAAIVGSAGLESSLAAIESGKRVALANKETLVVAGPIVNSLLQKSNAQLFPVDSEHSAIWQCLHGGPTKFARRLILTASGGPFRDWSLERMQQATPADALAHPTWRMGKKITVDSATMMNKALEIIEARWLFGVPAEQIEVVVHPQSVIHSLVEFTDGSVLAQLSPPDMRLPIQYALTYPERRECPAPPLDRGLVWNLQLQPVDRQRFPAIELGFEVARVGGSAGAVLNAANERAVELFLDGKIRLTEIATVCRAVLDAHEFDPNPQLEHLLALDRWARAEVIKWTCSART